MNNWVNRWKSAYFVLVPSQSGSVHQNLTCRMRAIFWKKIGTFCNHYVLLKWFTFMCLGLMFDTELLRIIYKQFLKEWSLNIFIYVYVFSNDCQSLYPNTSSYKQSFFTDVRMSAPIPDGQCVSRSQLQKQQLQKVQSQDSLPKQIAEQKGIKHFSPVESSQHD